MEDEVMMQIEEDVRQLREGVKQIESKFDNAMEGLCTEMRQLFAKMFEQVQNYLEQPNSGNIQAYSPEVEQKDFTESNRLSVSQIQGEQPFLQPQVQEEQPLIQELDIQTLPSDFLKIDTKSTELESPRIDNLDFLGVEQFFEKDGKVAEEKTQIVMLHWDGNANLTPENSKLVRSFQSRSLTYHSLLNHLSNTSTSFPMLLPTPKSHDINCENQTFDPGITKPLFTCYNVIYKLPAEFTFVCVGSYLFSFVTPPTSGMGKMVKLFGKYLNLCSVISKNGLDNREYSGSPSWKASGGFDSGKPRDIVSLLPRTSIKHTPHVFFIWVSNMEPWTISLDGSVELDTIVKGSSKISDDELRNHSRGYVSERNTSPSHFPIITLGSWWFSIFMNMQL